MRKLAFLLVLLGLYAWPGLGLGQSAERESANKADRAAVIAETPRVPIETPALRGSISLVGGRIDDLVLTQYRETIESDSPEIVLLSPSGSDNPYFADFGWAPRDVALPQGDTLWQANGEVLAPGLPVTLSWDNGQGLRFERLYEIDENYMFTVTQRVFNNGTATVWLAPYGLISRTGTPDILGFYMLHEGPLGVFDGVLKEVDYDDLRDEGPVHTKSTGGWIGITDKYWLVALVPDQHQAVETRFLHDATSGADKYQADYLAEGLTVQPGAATESRSRLFAGAKVVSLLDSYRDDPDDGIVNFDLAVDFGWFYFITKPLFLLLDWFKPMFLLLDSLMTPHFLQLLPFLLVLGILLPVVILLARRKGQGTAQLPVGRILSETLQYTIAHYFRILLWSLPAIVIIYLIEFSSDFFQIEKTFLSTQSPVLLFFLSSPILIMLHRNILISEKSSTNYFTTFTKSYFWSFIGNAALSAIIVHMAANIPAYFVMKSFVYKLEFSAVNSIQILPSLIYITIFSILLGRFILILPMKATESKIKRGWPLPRNNNARMTVVIFVTIVLPLFIMSVYREGVRLYLGAEGSITVVAIFTIIDALLYVVALSVFASSISYAYKALAEINTEDKHTSLDVS